MSYSKYFLLLIVCFLTQSCVQAKMVSQADVEPYTKLIGTRYILLTDCYIFNYVDSPRDYKLLGPIGANAPNFGIGIHKEMNPSLMNKRIGICYIQDFLSKGSVLKIVDIQKKVTFEHITYYRFYIEVETNVEKYGKLDAFWLVERDFPPEKFNENFLKKL